MKIDLKIESKPITAKSRKLKVRKLKVRKLKVRWKIETPESMILSDFQHKRRNRKKSINKKWKTHIVLFYGYREIMEQIGFIIGYEKSPIEEIPGQFLSIPVVYFNLDDLKKLELYMRLR